MDNDVAGGPATSLLRSLVQLGGTLLGAAETRFELLSAEVNEDLDRAIHIVLWAFVALLTGILGALLAGAAVIIVFWDTHRIAAVLGVTTAFLLVAAIAGLSVRKRLSEKPRFLDATRAELRSDIESLRGRQ